MFAQRNLTYYSPRQLLKTGWICRMSALLSWRTRQSSDYLKRIRLRGWLGVQISSRTHISSMAAAWERKQNSACARSRKQKSWGLVGESHCFSCFEVEGGEVFSKNTG